MPKFAFLVALASALIITACTGPTTSEQQDTEKQEHIANAMSEMEKARKDIVEQSHIIVFGQIQSDEEGYYLDTIEYLKTPKDYKKEDKLIFEKGVEAGRNIPSLNRMALAFFDENMTLLNIYKSSQGSPVYETWRQEVLASKRIAE